MTLSDSRLWSTDTLVRVPRARHLPETAQTEVSAPHKQLRLAWLFVAILSVAGSTHAEDAHLIEADRPGIADGSTTVNAGVAQAEIGVQSDRQNLGGVRTVDTTLPTLLRYGITDRLEGRIETDLVSNSRTTVNGESTRSTDLAPLSAGVKYHFLDSDKNTLRPSLGLIARLFVPSGSGESKQTRFTGDVRLAADIDLSEKWQLNPNIGAAIDRDDSGRRFTAALGAMTLQYSVSERVLPFIDIGVETPEARSAGASVILDGGIAWIVRPDTQLDIAVAHGVSGRTSPDFSWTAGVSRRF
jgi:hypothetical protein